MTKSPHPVDVHVGARVRFRRMLLGISQERLGRELGLTFQQVQKYEKGANRIGASRLHDIARILHAPVQYFFEDLADEPADTVAGGQEDVKPDNMTEFVSTPEGLELNRAFQRITDTATRRRLVDLVKAVADDDD